MYVQYTHVHVLQNQYSLWQCPNQHTHLSPCTLSKAFMEGSRLKPGRDKMSSRLSDTISVPARSHRVVTSASAPLRRTYRGRGATG